MGQSVSQKFRPVRQIWDVRETTDKGHIDAFILSHNKFFYWDLIYGQWFMILHKNFLPLKYLAAELRITMK